MGGLRRADVPPRSTGSPRPPRKRAGHHQQLWIEPRPRWTTNDRGTTIDLATRTDRATRTGRGSWPLPAWACSMRCAWCSVWAAGWLIDRALGTLPLFLFLGLIAGIAMGVLATRAEWKRYF